MVDQPVVDAVRTYLRALADKGLPVRFGVVFGSQANGQTGRWSDIDLLVISPRFDDIKDRSDVDLLWRVAARTDSRIEPQPCGEQQWKADGSSAILELARRSGQRIDLEDAVAAG